MKTNLKANKINFIVAPRLLALAYQGDKRALLEIAHKAAREKRLGLAKNFFRLADEHGNQQAKKLFKKVS